MKKSDIFLKNQKDSFSKELNKNSFFLLFKLSNNFYSNSLVQDLFYKQLEKLIKTGFVNLEIRWSDNIKWIEYASKLILKFPKLNLGSASIILSLIHI